MASFQFKIQEKLEGKNDAFITGMEEVRKQIELRKRENTLISEINKFLTSDASLKTEMFLMAEEDENIIKLLSRNDPYFDDEEENSYGFWIGDILFETNLKQNEDGSSIVVDGFFTLERKRTHYFMRIAFKAIENEPATLVSLKEWYDDGLH
jgi:hypothetical protein